LHKIPYNRRITNADVSQDAKLAPFLGMRMLRWTLLPVMDDGNNSIPIQARDMGRDRSGNLYPMGYPDVFEATVTFAMHPNQGMAHGGVFYLEKLRLIAEAPPELRAKLDSRADDEGHVDASGYTALSVVPHQFQSNFAAKQRQRIAAGQSLLVAPPTNNNNSLALPAPKSTPALMPPKKDDGAHSAAN
jgi:hypothetical protein